MGAYVDTAVTDVAVDWQYAPFKPSETIAPQPLVAPKEENEERLVAPGHQAPSTFGDRSFRTDVEGLRGIAILLVVVFHAWWLPLNGGFVGVDVFFVISGFVITGLLLRERAGTGHTNLLTFYARRVRRIVPMAVLVIVASLVATHLLLTHTDTQLVQGDDRWALVFLANIRISHAFPVIVWPTRPPSPIQPYWSLAIEEQFYLLYPGLFLLVAGIPRWSLRAKLAVVLTAVVIASFVYSVVSTSSANSLVPYYEFTTRAWELALGALVALGTGYWRRLPSLPAALMTWIGLGGILLAAFTYKMGHPLYPGSAVALPVVSAALVIAGGTAAPKLGAGAFLGLAPVRWLGRLSFSLYLWHFPLLSIASQRWPDPTLARQFSLCGVALVLSALTYYLIENPIRHSQFLKRHAALSIGLAVAVIGAAFGLTFVI
jgi:peptidoglycan/LPS O-acetylase OafA/YrhL